jgi:hypothetical protein
MTVTMLMSNLVESWELHNASQFIAGDESLKSLPREPDTICQQTAHEHSHNLNMQQLSRSERLLSRSSVLRPIKDF